MTQEQNKEREALTDEAVHYVLRQYFDDVTVEKAANIAHDLRCAAPALSASPAALTMEDAVAHIERKAEEYARDFGYSDMGSLSFGQGDHAQAKMDYYTSLTELADELRELAAQPAAPAPKCATCNDNGMIGGHSGQTPGSYEEWAEPCPDCTPAEPARADRQGVALSDEQIADMWNRSFGEVCGLRSRAIAFARALLSHCASSSRVEVENIKALVGRFLTWPVPASVYPDGIPGKPGRIGTNLLSALEAEEMLRYVLAAAEAPNEGDGDADA